LPAQQLDLRSRQWQAEVAIHSNWSSDFYTILHSGDDQQQIDLSLLENPLMRWIWFGGGLMLGGLCVCLWPARRRAAAEAELPRVIAFPQPAAVVRRKAA
jgi:cytochrome c biogenesis factor